MPRSKAPQRICLFFGILIDLVPFLFIASGLEFGYGFLIILICGVLSLPFYLLYYAIRRIGRLEDELDKLRYRGFRVDELLDAYEKGLPPFDRPSPSIEE